MNFDPEQFDGFPILAGIAPGEQLPKFGVRSLAPDEVTKFQEYKKGFSEAKNLFKVFYILRRNYEEWRAFIHSLVVPRDGLESGEIDELDRLLMNFLGAGKAVIDHSSNLWEEKYEDSEREQDFKDFLKRLESACWAYCFFQDFRNFVQHRGMPVGKFNRKSTATSAKLMIEADSEWLCEKYPRWKKSGLKPERGTLDLVDLTRDYYHYLSHDVPRFLVREFAPSLGAIHKFFADLAAEVAELDPTTQLFIVTDFEDKGDEKFRVAYSKPPSNLYEYLGIGSFIEAEQDSAEEES